MLAGGRNFYAVFMCHLSVEKALKGLYARKRGKVPPKTHNLKMLPSQVGIEAPPERQRFLFRRHQACVAT